jgi:hypothetical protein
MKVLMLHKRGGLIFSAPVFLKPDMDNVVWFEQWVELNIEGLCLLDIEKVVLRDRDHVYSICDINKEEEDHGGYVTH